MKRPKPHWSERAAREIAREMLMVRNEEYHNLNEHALANIICKHCPKQRETYCVVYWDCSRYNESKGGEQHKPTVIAKGLSFSAAKRRLAEAEEQDTHGAGYYTMQIPRPRAHSEWAV